MASVSALVKITRFVLLGMVARAELIVSLVIPECLYGAEIAGLTLVSLFKLRSAAI